MNPLTIVIPTYERPEFLAECLATVQAQTRRDFDVVVLDNGSAREYGPVLGRSSDLRIEYIRNETNIGSAANQARAREICTRSDFGMVFHDDDLMHPRLIEWELGFLESNPQVVWAAAESCSFIDGEPPPVELWDEAVGRIEVYNDSASLVRKLLEGVGLNFGSAIYRNAAMSSVVPQLPEAVRSFHILADRPYLLDVAESGSTALIREPLVLYRVHSAQDTFDPHFTEDHAIALMHYYRDFLPVELSPEDESLFLKHSTNYLLHAHALTRPENHASLRDAVRREKSEDLFRWRSIDGQGVAALATMAGFGRAFAALRPALGAAKRTIRPGS